MIRRESYFKIINEFIDTSFIKIFTGIRRSGKTTLLFSVVLIVLIALIILPSLYSVINIYACWDPYEDTDNINFIIVNNDNPVTVNGTTYAYGDMVVDELKNRGISEDNIFYISFESLKYQNITDSVSLNDLILDLIGNVEGKVYLLFDEIQLVDGWEKSINGLHADFSCDIYITGSNSMLLSGEYATLLSGRYIQINVYPFSFKEVLEYKEKVDNIEITDNIGNYIMNTMGETFFLQKVLQVILKMRLKKPVVILFLILLIILKMLSSFLRLEGRFDW